MQSYQEMSREELLKEKESLEQQYKEICKKGLKLDMSRGKPSKEQLALVRKKQVLFKPPVKERPYFSHLLDSKH